MNELFGAEGVPSGSETLMIAEVGSSTSSGTTLRFNSTGATTTRFKKVVTGQSLSAGDQVLVARVSGGYVIIGKIAY